jgi:hypothetical protein
MEDWPPERLLAGEDTRTAPPFAAAYGLASSSKKVLAPDE